MIMIIINLINNLSYEVREPMWVVYTYTTVRPREQEVRVERSTPLQCDKKYNIMHSIIHPAVWQYIYNILMHSKLDT